MNNDLSKIDAIVDRILEDYNLGRDIDKTDMLNRPDKETVTEIIEKLRRLVFPGFAKEKNYRIYTAKYTLSMLIEDVLFQLSRQISLALQAAGMPEEQVEERGRELSMAFLERIPAVRALVQTDLDATFEGDPAASGADEIIFSYPGLYAITVYRLAHELHVLGVPMIPRMMTEHAHSLTGIDIHPGATIGSHFFIDHGTGIVIGETTVIGRSVKLYQGVTLGALTTRGGQKLRGKRRHPTIEDRVTIYAGASILGGDTVIGEDCVIGSNVFLTASVPAGTTVAMKGQDLRIVKK